MLGENLLLNPLTQIEAKIQSRIATFLLLKETLVKLSRSDSVVISQQARSLLTVQSSLEGDLAKVLGDLEKFKQGAWTFSDVARLSSFYYLMENHIKDVGKLQQESKGVVESGLNLGDWVPWAVMIGLPLGILGVSKFLSKGRR